MKCSAALQTRDNNTYFQTLYFIILSKYLHSFHIEDSALKLTDPVILSDPLFSLLFLNHHRQFPNSCPQFDVNAVSST